MGKILIINGSPRAPRSHSARFAQIFGERCKAETEHVQLLHADHVQRQRKFEDCSDVLFVFPLYAEGCSCHIARILEKSFCCSANAPSSAFCTDQLWFSGTLAK